MMLIFAIALGGAVGALSRYGMSTGIYALAGRAFPFGTLAVNVLGSFLMGVLAVSLIERFSLTPEWRAAVLIGFLGSFTTFSTFSIETINLIEDGEPFKAGLNALLSVGFSVGACWVGLLVGRQI